MQSTPAPIVKVPRSKRITGEMKCQCLKHQSGPSDRPGSVKKKEARLVVPPGSQIGGRESRGPRDGLHETFETRDVAQVNH
jgi:hypothetical protein